MNSQRSAFEKVFPVPYNTAWNGHRYVTKSYLADDTPAITQQIRWEGWQAATEQGVGEPVAWMNDKPTTMGFYIMQSIDNASETFMARVYFEQDQVCLDFYDKNTFETVSEGYLLEKFDTRYKWMQIDARPPKPTGGGMPDNWRSEIEKAVKLASVFDDCGDGADDESARSVVGILSALLATQQPPEQE